MNAPIRVLVLAAVSAVSLSCTVQPSSPAEVNAVNASNLWLVLLDQGRYGEAWDQCAVMLRKTMSRTDWSSQTANVRKQMGPVKSRELKKIDHTTPTGAPEGEYIMLQYETSYANKNVVETLTPRREADGQWRVSGYYIK